MRRSWSAGMALALILATGAAEAQTLITPDVGVRGLGTTTTASGNVTIIGGGTLAGPNLFHSFSQFSLGAGDVARWTPSGGDPNAVRNVVSRVTGGQPSNISGEIDSTALPNAAFFFINPAGIVFGAGARLNVPATAYFSTASELRFADGGKFAMATPGGSTLSIAAPQSFGFIGGEDSVTMSGLTSSFAGAGTALSVTGANITVSGSAFSARGLDLAAVGRGAADVSLANPVAAPLGGTVTIKASQLTTITDAGGEGSYRIGGGAISLDSSNLVSDTAGVARGADVTVTAAGTLALSNNTLLGAETRGTGAGGNVTLTAKTLTADGGAAFVLTQTGAASGQLSLTADAITLGGAFTASSNSNGPGTGGSIAITARNALSMDGANAVASALAAGPGGGVTLTAPVMTLNNALATSAGVGSGKPGDVRLSGGTIVATGGLLGSAPGSSSDTGSLDIEATASFAGTNVSMAAASLSAGSAGTITISAPKVALTGGFIETDSFGAGGVGTVTIQGGDLALDGAQIEAEARGTTTGQLGLVQLKATGDIHISQGLIASDAFSTSRGGTISISGANITLDNAKVESNSAGPGGGGELGLKASGALHLGNGSTVTSDASSLGDAGDVSLSGQTVTIDGGSVVSSDTLSSGRSGAVTVGAGALTVSAGAISSSTFGDGAAGNVAVTADSATVDRGGVIVSEALQFSTGQAGTVDVTTAGALKIAGGGLISTTSGGAGDAGAVAIKAGSLSVDAAELSSAAASGATGASGSLTISADSVSVTGGGLVTTLSNDPKTAGQISVTADDVLVSGAGSEISSENQAGNRAFGNRRGQAGDAGAIRLAARRITVSDGGAISTNSFAGAAGQIGISIETPGVLVLQGLTAPGYIQTSSGPGTGGKITIDEPLA
ncbi:MAG: filamentous hemagglutinin N-terminal domain-containing protein, partial [Proteobacteria bacterium]|nr:filamentous hemagglutinin N-terminal domain-containing protein [Pseudomonadota bacterium]